MPITLISWTIIRGFFACFFVALLFFSFFGPDPQFISGWNRGSESAAGAILTLAFYILGACVCTRAAIENSNVWTREVLNPFRKLDFNNWHRQTDWKYWRAKLVEIPGVGPKTADEIIRKLKNGEELTEYQKKLWDSL